jgi:ribosomal protein S27AE
MSEIETLSCPACGKGVQSSGGPAKAEWSSEAGTRASSKENKACPHCGAALVREVLPGSPWRVLAEQ